SQRLLQELDLIIEEAVAREELRTDISPTDVRDLFLAMLDGLTRQHVANEPETPIGSGRYGGLVPAAIAVFRTAWQPESPVTGSTGVKEVSHD
ncbi:MAG TPA: hypothetical protein VKA25_06350, partial [Gemmatimonadales bacterium]|nr:hypothetical protein [Gemmatimonadales bacterium]